MTTASNGSSFTNKILETRISLSGTGLAGSGLDDSGLANSGLDSSGLAGSGLATYSLASSSFANLASLQTIRGLATTAHIEKNGLPDKNKASICIQGMRYESMASLTTLAFNPLESRRNSITLLAGDEKNGLSVAFTGEITQAYANFNTAPDVTFIIEAMSGAYPALIAEQPLVVQGNAPLEGILRQLAASIGYAFVNEGFTGQLKNAVLNGSPIEKAIAAAEQMGAELIIDDGSLILLPPDGRRRQEASGGILVSKETGMIGYPTFNNDGISLKCLYNPSLQYGGGITVQSIVPKASGEWKITRLAHRLSAFGAGEWVSEIEAI